MTVVGGGKGRKKKTETWEKKEKKETWEKKEKKEKKEMRRRRRRRERRERWGGEERISGPIYGSVARGCRGQGADAERSVSLFLTHARVHTRRSSLVDTVITLD